MFTKEQLQQARRTNLFDYMTRYHSEMIRREGHSIRLLSNDSLAIREGYCGYYDFATGDKGNSIDFLIRHLGYTVNDAVSALVGSGCVKSPSIQDKPYMRVTELPQYRNGQYKHLFAYLQKRGIESDTTKMLINAGLLYEDYTEYHNIVFQSREKDYAEIHGTGNKPFHQCRKVAPDRCWYFNKPTQDKKPEIIYVCEAAIDAISLFQIRKDTAFYASVGGVSNQQAIDRIKKLPLKVILAVDNDEAGQQCRDRNRDIEHIIPFMKDWNEDLQADERI